MAALQRLDSVSPYQGGRKLQTNRLTRVDWMQQLQWPAMIATLLSSWLVAEQSKTKRKWGFWVFLLSDVLWVAWGWKAHAYALILLQFGLAALNIRGVAKNERA